MTLHLPTYNYNTLSQSPNSHSCKVKILIFISPINLDAVNSCTMRNMTDKKKMI